MKRLKELDILRGIAICFMVFGHTWFTREATVEMERLIYAFHMTLFFIISGFFYRSPNSNASVKQIVLKKMRSLLVPYFVFGIIYIFIDQFVWKTTSLTVSIRNILLFPTGTTNKVSQLTEIPGESALWFLMALFIMNILYLLLEVVFKNEYVRVAIILVLAIVMFIVFSKSNHYELPFALRIVFECMPYFYLGILFKRYYKNIKDFLINHKIITIAIWLVSLAVFITLATINPKDTIFDIFRNNWGIIPLTIFNSVLGFFVFWIVSVCIDKYLKIPGKFLSFCGSSTIVFVCINHLVIKYVKELIIAVSGTIKSYYQMIVVCVLSVAICALIAVIVMKTKLKVIFGK